jgi:hypothetical protein
LLETGIKVIDVMCPLVAGGNAILAGELNTGPVVTLYELTHKLNRGPDALKLFTLMPLWREALPGSSFLGSLKEDGFTDIPCGASARYNISIFAPRTGRGPQAGCHSSIRSMSSFASRAPRPRRRQGSGSRCPDIPFFGNGQAGRLPKWLHEVVKLQEPARAISGEPSRQSLKSGIQQPFSIEKSFVRQGLKRAGPTALDTVAFGLANDEADLIVAFDLELPPNCRPQTIDVFANAIDDGRIVVHTPVISTLIVKPMTTIAAISKCKPDCVSRMRRGAYRAHDHQVVD